VDQQFVGAYVVGVDTFDTQVVCRGAVGGLRS